MLLQEPVLVVLAFYLLFVLVIIYVRLDFSITKVGFRCTVKFLNMQTPEKFGVSFLKVEQFGFTIE